MENSATSPTVTLDDSNFEKEVTQSDQTVLVDFWAPWCGPCKMIAPLLDEIATEKAGSVKVAKVNVDENQSLSVKYNVRAIPALLFFKNGQLRDQVVGMTTRKDLLGRLDALTKPTFGFPQSMQPWFAAIHNGGTSVNGISAPPSPFGVEKGDKIY